MHLSASRILEGLRDAYDEVDDAVGMFFLNIGYYSQSERGRQAMRIRLKTHTVYPLKYLLTKRQRLAPTSQNYKKHKTLWKERVVYSMEKFKGKMKHPIKKLKKTKSYPPCFPADVWLKISEHLANPGVLIRVNKELCDIFAPFVYSQLSLFLAVSSTDKMKLNDQNFLLHGKDFASDKVDGYAIYKRHKTGRGSDYHFLDISRRQKFIRNEDGHYNPNVISNYNDVMWVLKEIVENSESFLRRYVTNITVSVHVLRGFNRPLGNDDVHGITENPIIPAIAQGKAIHCNPERYVTLDLPETFGIQLDREICGRSFRTEDTLHTSYPDHMLARRKFPTEVYSKEVTGTSIMLGFAENKIHNNKLDELVSYEELCQMNPYVEWNNNPYIENKGVRNTEEKEKALLSVREFLSVSIESLDNFKTKEEVQSILKRTITSVMNPENTSGINVRMLISGPSVDSELNPEPIPFRFRRVGENILAFNITPETSYDPILYLLKN